MNYSELLKWINNSLNYVSESFHLSCDYSSFIRDDYDEDEMKLFMKCCISLDDDDCVEFVLKYIGYMIKLDKEIDINDYVVSCLKNDEVYNCNYLVRCINIINRIVNDVDDLIESKVEDMYEFQYDEAMLDLND